MKKLWRTICAEHASWMDRITAMTDTLKIPSDEVVRNLIREGLITSSQLLELQEEYDRARGGILTDLANELRMQTVDGAPEGELTSERDRFLHVLDANPEMGTLNLEISGKQYRYFAPSEVIERFLKYQNYNQGRALAFIRQNARLVKEEVIPDARELIDAALLSGDLDGEVDRMFEAATKSMYCPQCKAETTHYKRSEMRAHSTTIHDPGLSDRVGGKSRYRCGKCMNVRETKGFLYHNYNRPKKKKRNSSYSKKVKQFRT